MQFEVGDKVMWAHELKKGDEGIERDKTTSWPQVGDIDEVVKVTKKAVYLKNFCYFAGFADENLEIYRGVTPWACSPGWFSRVLQ